MLIGEIPGFYFFIMKSSKTNVILHLEFWCFNNVQIVDVTGDSAKLINQSDINVLYLCII